MKFSYTSLKAALKTSFFLLCFIPSLFGFKSFTDKAGHAIEFSVKKDQDFIKEKAIFVDSFTDNYSILPPQNIKPKFESHKDVKTWLEGVFDNEQKDFQKASHPVYWVNITKDKKVIGFAIFEQWKDQPQTWHIRQMVILPKEQKNGYGKSLVFSILDIKPNITKLVADTRKQNPKGRPFFNKIGFKELEKPHDPELDPQDKYIGLEWTKKENTKKEITQTE